MRVTAIFLGLIFLAAARERAVAATPVTPANEAPAGSAELFELGRALFDQFAPPEIKAEYEFPSKERWDDFAARLQRALEGDSLQDLAVYLPEARTALTGLRAFPGYEEYADWLEQRIDEIEAADQLTRETTPTPNAPPPSPGRKSPPVPTPSNPPPSRAGTVPN